MFFPATVCLFIPILLFVLLSPALFIAFRKMFENDEIHSFWPDQKYRIYIYLIGLVSFLSPVTGALMVLTIALARMTIHGRWLKHVFLLSLTGIPIYLFFASSTDNPFLRVISGIILFTLPFFVSYLLVGEMMHLSRFLLKFRSNILTLFVVWWFWYTVVVFIDLFSVQGNPGSYLLLQFAITMIFIVVSVVAVWFVHFRNCFMHDLACWISGSLKTYLTKKNYPHEYQQRALEIYKGCGRKAFRLPSYEEFGVIPGVEPENLERISELLRLLQSYRKGKIPP